MTFLEVIGLIIIILGIWIIIKFYNNPKEDKRIYNNLQNNKHLQNNIKRFSDILGRNTDGIDVDDFIRTLNNYGDYKEVQDEFYETCLNQDNLKKIFEKYNFSKTDLEAEYILLSANGASCWAGGHYVLVNAFLNENTLDYILRTWKENLSISQRVFTIIQYFKNNRNDQIIGDGY